MTFEYIIIIAAWLISAISLFISIPKDKIRLAHVAFLFKQVMTWILGLSFVQMKLLEYPVRLFPYANRTSFTFEFFVYPAICAIFNVYYPEVNNKLRIVWHYVSYTYAITISEVLLQRYTQLIKYIHWSWYWTWIMVCITFLFSRLYVRWFCKLT